MSPPLAHKYNLPQIRHIIDSTATARIPGQVDPSAISNLIKQTIILWNPIVNRFLNSCGRLLNNEVHQCFSRVFKEYTKSPIHNAVYEILNRLVNEAFSEEKIIIERLLTLEAEQITTLNEEDYQKHTENQLKILSDRRARNIEDQNIREAAFQAAEAAKHDESMGTPRRRRTALPPPVRENQPDPYKKEICVLADVKAYSEIAQKRFVDNVYMSIQGEFVGGFRKSVLEALQSGLGLNTPEGMCSCLLFSLFSSLSCFWCYWVADVLFSGGYLYGPPSGRSTERTAQEGIARKERAVGESHG